MSVSNPGDADECEAEAVAEDLISADGNESVAVSIRPATSAIQRLPDACIRKVAQGETTEFGAEASNRR
jgi:hypothetical protein